MCCKVLVVISLILGAIGAGLGIWNVIEIRGYSADTFICDICKDISSTTGILPYEYCSVVCNIDVTMSCSACVYDVDAGECGCSDPKKCTNEYCLEKCGSVTGVNDDTCIDIDDIPS